MSLSFLAGIPALADDHKPIEVALGDVSINKFAFLVAADAGIYEENGLSVHQFVSASAANRVRKIGVEIPDEFVKDDHDMADISIGGGSPLIVSMTSDAETADRVILATNDSLARFHIVSSKDLQSIDDIKGKRLGFSGVGSVSHLMALSLLKVKGWNPSSDVSLMADGTSLDVLHKGKVDAFVASDIYYTVAGKNDAADLGDLSQFNIPIAGSGINARRDWLANNHEAASRFVKSMIDAYALMKKDKSVAVAAMAKWFNITDPAQQDQMYATVMNTPEKPYPAVDGIKQVLSLYDYRE
jgi:ABC-type nitrate/sulfonate/bicarbonate transport system substrate-binding protein